MVVRCDVVEVVSFVLNVEILDAFCDGVIFVFDFYAELDVVLVLGARVLDSGVFDFFKVIVRADDVPVFGPFVEVGDCVVEHDESDAFFE